MKRSRPTIRGLAVLAVVALGALAVTPAMSAFSPTKAKIKSIAKKEANKVRKTLQAEINGIPLDSFGNSFVRVVATGGVDEATARTNAPKTPLFSQGPFSIYAKCFRDDTGPLVIGEVYIETTTAGAIFDSNDGDALVGGSAATDFLNPTTPEDERQIYSASATADTTSFGSANNEDWHAMAPDGTNLDGAVSVAVKSGTLTEGNFVYGAGDVCLFGGFGIGD